MERTLCKGENGRRTELVEVVRCKNCIHMTEHFGGRYCEIWTMFNGMGDDGFCNYGERKNDNGKE
jgi:hypothetical protein